MVNLTPRQAEIVLAALRRHDGQSIHPELADRKAWRELTDALDKLRIELMDVAEVTR